MTSVKAVDVPKYGGKTVKGGSTDFNCSFFPSPFFFPKIFVLTPLPVRSVSWFWWGIEENLLIASSHSVD